MTIALLSAGLLLCVVLSFFFSSSEMSYSAANRVRIENLKDSGSKKAARAWKIIENFDDALGAILTGNNLVNISIHFRIHNNLYVNIHITCNTQ